MKILMLVQSLEKGGRTVRITDTAKELIARGNNVKIITFTLLTDTIHDSLLQDLDIVVFEKKQRFDFKLLYRISRILSVEGFDLIHAHCESSYLYGGLAGRFHAVPVIGTYHRSNLSFFEPSWRYKLLNRLLDHCVAISFDRKRLIVDNLGRQEDQVSVIHGGVNIEELLLAKSNRLENIARLEVCSGEGPVLLSLGHLGEIKGHDIVIKSMVTVIQQYPQAVLYICGSGEESEKRKLLDLVDSLGLSEHIHLVGQVDNPSEWLSVADIFVMAPREEGFGLVFAEASVLALPIVASRVGGIPDIIQEEKTGLLVNPDSVEEIAGAVLRFIGDKSLATQLGSAASARAQHLFSRQIMGDQYEHLIDDMFCNMRSGKADLFPPKKSESASVKAYRQPLRIAHFVSSLNIGGAERFAIDLSMQQKREGLTPIIINMGHFSDLFVEVAKSEGVKTYSPKANNRWITFRRILQILSENKIDICQIHSPAIVKYLLPVMPFVGQKVIYTRHGERTLSSKQWRLVHYILRPFIHKVTFVSSGGMDVFIQHQGWPRSKCQVVENGVYLPPIEVDMNASSRAKPIRIGSVGRMVDLKKQIHLLEAFFQLKAEMQNQIELHFFGSGPELEPLKEFVKEKKNKGKVLFHGAVLEREDIYQAFEVLVVNSETEGLSLAIMEAMARAKAVIASDVGGNSQLVDHQISGFIYPYGDIESLKAHIEFFIENPCKIKEMGAEGREKMRSDYSMEETSRCYMEIYNE